MASVEYGTFEYVAEAAGSGRRAIFCPEELSDIQKFFDECCMECGFEKQTQQALALGRAIMRLYRQGQYDQKLLRKLFVSPLKIAA